MRLKEFLLGLEKPPSVFNRAPTVFRGSSVCVWRSFLSYSEELPSMFRGLYFLVHRIFFLCSEERPLCLKELLLGLERFSSVFSRASTVFRGASVCVLEKLPFFLFRGASIVFRRAPTVHGVASFRVPSFQPQRSCLARSESLPPFFRGGSLCV